MAFLLRFSFCFSLVICFMVSASLPLREDHVKIIKPFFDVTSLCTDKSIYARNRKLICLICKGLDPSCFGTTSTTTTSTTSTSTTSSTTTPASTTASSTTTTPTSSTTPTTTTAAASESK